MSECLPPRAARVLLEKILPDSFAEDVARDLDCAYGRRLAMGWNRWRAGAWYYGQVLSPNTFKLAQLLRARDQRELGGTGLVMDSLLDDLRYVLRTLVRRPVWTGAVLCTLALGLGGTTAMFSIVYGVMLQPLPYENSEELMAIRRGDRWGWETVSYPLFEDFKERQQVFERVGVWAPTTSAIGFGETPELLRGAMVSSDIFPILRVNPVMGRGFTARDDLEGAPGVIVLSHAMWVGRFGGDPNILGETITVDGALCTVVGVMPEDFAFPNPGVLFWESLATGSRVSDRFYLRPIGRLRPGINQAIAREFVAGQEWVIPPYDNRPERVEPLQAMSLLAYTARSAPTVLLILQSAALALLLIACFNVTNLVLARAIGREGECSLRAALGAGRTRIVRLALTETAVLGVVGGGLGLLLAFLVLQVTASTIPSSIPLQERIQLGAPVIVAGFLLALGAGAGIGLLPALRATHVDLRTVLQGTTRGFTEGRGRTRLWSLLVGAQLAVAVVLLAGGGLLLKSYANLNRVDSGFREERVLMANIRIPRSAYPDMSSRKTFYDELVKRLESRPQVRRAAVVANAPFSGAWADGNSEVSGTEAGIVEVGFTEFQTASSGYFETMGIPMLSGRDFNSLDETEETFAAIVNETLALRHFPSGGAIGKQVRAAGDDTWRTVVGVVGDVTHRGLDTPPTPQIYYPYSLSRPAFRMTLAVYTDRDPLALVNVLRETVAAIDPTIPIPTAYTLARSIQQSVANQRFQMWFLTSFAAVALLLAIIGLYGVVAHGVAHRTREFGIRKALGADATRVVREVVRGTAMVLVGGLTVGLAAALALAGVLESFLFGVSARDPLVFGVVSATLGLCAIVATYIPARRAGLMDPLEAIRTE